MSELITLANGAVFRNPEDRIREYCDIEVYNGYDDRHSVDNRITMDDVTAANELYAMIDRYDPTESSRIVGSTHLERALANLADLDLMLSSEDQWASERRDVASVLHEFLLIRGVGLAKATKILHLKRPHLFPVLDSFVVMFLTGKDVGEIMNKENAVRLGMQAMDVARTDLRNNKGPFQALQIKLQGLPIPITAARMYDILCWTEEKWVNRRNTHAKYGVARRSLA